MSGPKIGELCAGYGGLGMGVKAVLGVPGLSRNDMLKALGNGVVPQQAATALRFLFNARTAA